MMNDTVSKLDWALDTFMEPLRMKCWVSIQGKAKKWVEPRSPYSRATNLETLCKSLDAELVDSKKCLSHDLLRDIAVGHGEAIPPTVELYLQTIHKLNPSSICAVNVNYGVSLAALACVVQEDLPCYYNLNGMTAQAVQSLREFVIATGRPLQDVGSAAAGPTPASASADLLLIDAVPHGSHDLRAYLGDDIPSYKDHLDGILKHLRSVKPAGAPVRIALVISLRESHSLPTVEPLLLSILCEENISLVGALVSHRRDYAVYLMLTGGGETGDWKKVLQDHYPELSGQSSARPPVIKSLKPASTEPWDVVCLKELMANLREASDTIASQGPRITRGKAVFPSRTRSCVMVSETSNLETGDIVYVFGDVIEPPQTTVPVEVLQKPVDPLLSRMVAGIKESIEKSE